MAKRRASKTGKAGNSDVQALLKKFKKGWQDTPVQERGMLPAGRYQFEVGLIEGKATVVEDSDGGVRARVLLAVVAGPEGTAERKVTKSWGIFTPDKEPDEIGQSILKSDLNTLGLDVEELDLEDLPDTLAELAGAVVDAAVVIKDDRHGIERQNIYINGLAKEASKSSRRRRS